MTVFVFLGIGFRYSVSSEVEEGGSGGENAGHISFSHSQVSGTGNSGRGGRARKIYESRGKLERDQ